MRPRAGVVLAIGAGLYAVPAVLGPVGLRMAVEVLYFGLFAVSFNLLFGYAGLLSFGHAAGFGVGAYAFGLALKHGPGLSLPAALVAGALAGAASGLVVGFFCVRLRGTYFALLTLAFSQFLYATALKWRDLTRGDDGLTVPAPDLHLGVTTLRAADPRHYYWIALTVVLLSLAVAWRVTRTPLGHAVLLTRENDERAAFLGYNVFATKLAIFAFAATLAAVAGGLFAGFQRLVSPAALDLPLSTEVVFMAVLGGTGAFLGPFLGAAAYIVLQNWLARLTPNWPFFIGLGFVLVVLYAPGGLIGLLHAKGPMRRLALRRTRLEEGA